VVAAALARVSLWREAQPRSKDACRRYARGRWQCRLSDDPREHLEA